MVCRVRGIPEIQRKRAYPFRDKPQTNAAVRPAYGRSSPASFMVK